MNHRELLFLDTETTGLDAAKHEIIDIAWILTSPDGREIRSKFSARMLPQHLETAEPKALEINGFSEAAWRAGPKPLMAHDEVADKFATVSKDRVLVAHNVSFDEGFVRALLLKQGKSPRWSYHKVDTVALAWPLFSSSDLTGLSLGTLCQHLGIKNDAAHTAEADVQACYDVYHALMSRYLK